MKPYYKQNGITIYCGNCLDVLPQLEKNSVATILTDPPYGLSFMGKDWDHGVPGVRFWEEIMRVAIPGAHLLSFGGTRTYHRLVCAIEDAGWEIRDCIMWIYGSGFPKSHNISKAIDKAKGEERKVIGEVYARGAKGLSDRNKLQGVTPYKQGVPNQTNYVPITTPATPLAQQFDGYGTALKPAYEPIVVAMKPLDGTFAENAEKWGVSGLWIDGGRIETETPRPKLVLDPKETNNSTYAGRMNNSLQGDSKAIGTTTQGRWPANVIHDGSDEVEKEFAKAGERKSGVAIGENASKGTVYGGGKGLISQSKGNEKKGYDDNSTSVSRFFMCCPQENREEVVAANDLEVATRLAVRFKYVAKASPKERGKGNNHPTVKPLALLKYLTKLTKSPTGGIVLDPFMGSGTTLLAALEEGRPAIGIELNEEYCEIAVRRIKEKEAVQRTLL